MSELVISAALNRSYGSGVGQFNYHPCTPIAMSIPSKLLTVFVFLSCTLGAAPIWREVSIPTRAAAPNSNLLADIYVNDSSVAKPVILIQTPYNKVYYRLALNSVLNKSGASVPYDTAHYNYVIVDWRGYYANKNVSITPYDRGLDGYDIVEWIAHQSWSNGRVGTWGGSALGFIQFQTAAQHPPHLVCCAPFIKDFETKYEDYYYGGDFRREQVTSLQTLGFTTVNAVLSHPLYDNTWTFIENQSSTASAYAVPMFLCSGWFDHYPNDVLRAFRDLQTQSDPAVRSQHKLMFGPFQHSEIGQAQQGVLSYPDVEGVPTELGMKFFDHYLRQLDNGWDTLPAVRYYQMGENAWHDSPSWPVGGTEIDTLFFHELNRMTAIAPDYNKRVARPDTFSADPRKPMPTIGGSRFDPTDKTILTGPQDIASLTSRADQWYYLSDTLQAPLVIRGNSGLHLRLSVSTLDADICARLCDVYPDGRWIILTQAAQRLRLRNSLSQETLMSPNSPEDVRVHFQDVAQTFLPGHRVGLLISTADYPMFDLNINDGGPMYSAGDTTVTSVSISNSQPNPSFFFYTSPALSSAVEESVHYDEALLAVPNPAQDHVELRYSSRTNESVSVKAYSLLGQLLFSRTMTVHQGANVIALPLNVMTDCASQTITVSVVGAQEAHSIPIMIMREGSR